MVFLTPTVIKGDAAGAQVVAHELAHSWTGNLITNKTNEDFWLNEVSGLTLLLVWSLSAFTLQSVVFLKIQCGSLYGMFHTVSYIPYYVEYLSLLLAYQPIGTACCSSKPTCVSCSL